MLTGSFSEDFGDKRWVTHLRSFIIGIYHRFQTPRVIREPSAGSTWEDDPILQKAILTFRMAANPGESYEVVAARIESEAARYKEFLRCPKPIGKIILFVKTVSSKADENEGTRQQYQVRHPDKGQASIAHTLDRSDSQIFEFVVYDEDDNILFPIARTYSNWVGEEEFDLGLGRTFCLKMTETDSPARVRVQAGFPPLAIKDVRTSVVTTDIKEPQPLAAFTAQQGDTRDDLVNSQTNFLTPSFFNRLVYTCVGISLFCCLSSFWAVTANHLAQPNEDRRVPPLPITVFSPSGEELTAPSHTTVGAPPDGVKLWQAADYEFALLGQATEQTPKSSDRLLRLYLTREKRERVKTHKLQKAARMAGIEQLSILVDNASCYGRCAELLSECRDAIKTNLSRLNLHVAPATQGDDVRYAARLILSYKPVDDSFGHVYVTLYDQKGLLWGEHDDCIEYGEDSPDNFVSKVSEGFSKGLAEEIKLAKERLPSATKVGMTEPAGRGEMLSLTN